MAIYTFADTKSAANGTTALRVAAGVVHIGESLDLTAGEVTALSPNYDLRAGTVAFTPVFLPTVYKRPDNSRPQNQRSLRQFAQARAAEYEKTVVEAPAPKNLLREAARAKAAEYEKSQA